MSDGWRFFMRFLRSPSTIGALVPSSPPLARAMVERCDWTQIRTVAELGPGTGAFTEFILERMRPETLYLGLELDPGNYRTLKAKYPHAHIEQASAETLPDQLKRHHRDRVEAVISGLPWASMRPELQDRILQAVISSMAPKGLFATFAYLQGLWLPASRRFRQRLHQAFADVQVSSTVWRNSPPARVIYARARS